MSGKLAILEEQQLLIHELNQRLQSLENKGSEVLPINQDRIEQLEVKVEQLQANQIIDPQEFELEQLEHEMSGKLAMLEEQQLLIHELNQRLQILENKGSEVSPITEQDVGGVLLDLEQKLARLEQQMAATQPSESSEFMRVTSVDKVTDISSEELYFQALKEMLERYSLPLCYPDSTFRGDRPLSRQEFVQHIAVLTREIQRLIEFYRWDN